MIAFCIPFHAVSASNTSMAKPNYLSTQLRESAPYLKDAGWRDTAALMTAAADEIEALRQRIAELEGNSAPIRIVRTG